MKSKEGNASKKAKKEKQTVRLKDGRKVRLTAGQIKLFELCNRVAGLPREIIEKVLSDVSKPILLVLKYHRGLRDVAFSLAHRYLVLDEDNALEDRRDLLTSLGSAIKNFCYFDESPNYPLLIEFLVHEQLPSLRYFNLVIPHDEPAIPIDHARVLIEKLGTLPFLASLAIHDGGRGDEPLSKVDKIAINAIRKCRILSGEKRSSLFPTLRKLTLSNASMALAACILSRQCKLTQLRRLEITRLRCEINPKDFPRNLTALVIQGSNYVGYNTVLQLVQRSRNTLEALLYHDQGTQPLLNYISSPIVECPNLQHIAIHDMVLCPEHHQASRSDDDKAIQTPDWTRRSIGFFSRIVAPSLTSMGIGWTLFDAMPTALLDLVGSTTNTKLETILCRHDEPVMSDPEGTGGDGAEVDTVLQGNFALLTGLCETAGIDLLCLDEEDYDQYIEDAFTGELEL